MFLTIGIALGSWWAYYELGWGGWWFWDPVENASFMPWLIGTALVHSLAATEKRGVFKAWTLLLAVIAFSLSLLGTFLVRSGVLISVHAFASDPSRGLFILIFLSVVVGGSLLLYAWRAPMISSRIRFSVVSRETAILLNNVIFGVLCFSVLLGTLYPLILDSLGMGKISVGPPYFDFIFSLVGFPLLLLMGFGALIRWKKDRPGRLSGKLVSAVVPAVVLALLLPLLLPFYSPGAVAGLFGGILVIVLSLQALTGRMRGPGKLQRLKATPISIYGMIVAHFGIGVFIIGVTMTNVYSIEKDIRMESGDLYEIGDYGFKFNGTTNTRGPNYRAVTGSFDIFRNEHIIATLLPEKRTYMVQKNPMTEAAIDAGFTRDIYIALGEPLENDQAWAVRIYYKPFIRWIWLGAIFMAMGGLLGALDRRYRKTGKLTRLSPAQVSG
jgi:cytochrome c-type biogenesis protein CcmF